MFRKLLFVLLSFALASFAQQPSPPSGANQRDLRVEPLHPAPTNNPIISGRKTLPRRYAVVIGVGQYPNLPPNLQLKYSERDADSIFAMLISPEGGNYPAENVHRLVGPKATLANIRHELEDWLPTTAKPDDLVFIYFAGHGFLIPSTGRAYLAPYDFRIKDAAETGYSMETLGKVVQNSIKAKYKVLLTDACHSGAIAPEAAQEMNHELVSLDQSLFSLTASRDRESSLESPDLEGGHGVFTYYVVQGMQGAADEKGDGYVTADELAEYVRRNVREATNARQNPTSERGSYDPQMLLAYVPSHVRPETPPSKNGGFIFESNMDKTEVFLDGTSVGIVEKGKPLPIPGLTPGPHTVKAVHMGYEPDGPREEVVYPGQDTTVSLRLVIPRRRSQAATDQLDRGVQFYGKGFAANYQQAVQCFNAALAIDPNYSEAALYLGRAYNALFDEEKAATAFRRAIAIDPDYMEARTAFAGELLDTGQLDEAIRQLNLVNQREPKNGQAWYLLSQAYCRKGAYQPAVEAGRSAVAITPFNGEAHLWLAESLHQSKEWNPAVKEYNEYLRLSDFDSKLGGQVSYYVLGSLFGIGKRSRASQQDIWKDQRGLAYFGLCDCEHRLSHFDEAISDCTRSLRYSPDGALVHYLLGISYAYEANLKHNVGLAEAARQHFATMLTINPDLAEAAIAKRNIANIDHAIQAIQ